jgi:hypothetical protein
MKHIILLLVAMLSFTGCSFLYYGSDERTLMVVDLHPGGESIEFSGELDGVANAELNREQGSSEDVITDTVDSLTGIPGL